MRAPGSVGGDDAGAVRAQLGGVAVPVDHVVDGLEEHAELLPERPPRRLRRRGNLRRPEPQPDGSCEQPSGLEPMEVLEGDVRAGDVEVLPADHPERRLCELADRLRPAVAEREVERLREQRVTGEQRHALAERDVQARPAPPLVVVVHRREVVVDEREGVHELEPERGRKSALDGASRGLRRGEADHRPDPLAAASEGVPDRAPAARRARIGA